MLFNRKRNSQAQAESLTQLELENEKLSAQIEMQSGHLDHAISEVNRLNQYITKMDFVKDMIVNLNLQLENIEMVAASSEEISSSIIEIAEHISDNTRAAQNSVDITERGTQALRNSVKSMVQAYEMTSSAKSRVGDVTTQAAKINEMVGIIEAVAGQTNLLALNASIEAARAGDAGRGFAVVADEIKKLAESTKDSVKLIQDTVASLNGSVESSVDAIEQATRSFEVGMEEINSATQLVEASENEINKILSSMETVRDQIESQTAASEEVASSVAQINESAKQLHKETTQTGKAFSDIALEVNGIRLDLLKRKPDLLPSYTIELAITDHMNWRWDIYNMIMGFQKINADKLGTHRECRLGKWIDLSAKNVVEFQPIIKRLNGPHEALHRSAAEAVKLYSHGDIKGAESQLALIDGYSKTIVSDLSSLLAVALELEKGKRQTSYFKWTSDLTVYNEEIDTQHKQLLMLGAKLESFSRSSKKSKEEFLSIVKEVKDYTVYHFSKEEQMLVKSHYPDVDNHKKIHKVFVDEINAVDFMKFNFNDAKALDDLILFLSKWVVKHIKNEDFKYSNHLGKM